MSNPLPENLAALQDVLLKAYKPMTAKQIAKRLKVSKQTVYARIEALKPYRPIITVMVREGSHGPMSQAFSVGVR